MVQDRQQKHDHSQSPTAAVNTSRFDQQAVELIEIEARAGEKVLLLENLSALFL
jgi:hypothetical protein